MPTTSVSKYEDADRIDHGVPAIKFSEAVDHYLTWCGTTGGQSMAGRLTTLHLDGNAPSGLVGEMSL
jgi:hypothetical protein